MKNVIGQRIKSERQSQNLTQEELIVKSQLEWDRQTLGSVERGERDLKAWELGKLSKALKIEVSSFFYEKSSEKSVILWRNKPERFKEVEANFFKLCKDYKFIEDINKIKIESFRSLPSRSIDLNVFTYNDANVLAEEIRDELDLGDYPSSVIINVLEEKYGVKFFFNDLGGHGSAACSISDDGKSIIVSSSEVSWRQKFSIAHELFHLLTWNNSLLDQIESDNGLCEYNEKLANAFAGGLLVPSEALKREVNIFAKKNKLSDGSLVAIATQFGVSLEALLWRMSSVRLVTRDSVLEALNDSGLRTLDQESRSTIDRKKLLSKRFVRLAYVAFENGGISRARLAKMLNSNLSSLSKVLKNYGLVEVKNNEISLNNS